MKRIILITLCFCLLFVGIIPAYGVTDAKTVENTVKALGIMTGDEYGNLNLYKNVTRAEFAKMLVQASYLKDSVQEGSGSSPFKDVKHTHWASDYIKTVVTEKWMVGYVDGTFRPEGFITLEEAASAILRLLGYDSSTLFGTYPNAQISKFNALKLGAGISPVQGKSLTRNECLYIFYNLMGAVDAKGTVYGSTQGYTMNSAGEIDYGELIKKDIQGPYILKGTTLASVLPFDISQATIYRNGKVTSTGETQQYDVIYYNVSSKDVWIYSNRVVGTLTGIAPDTVAPTSVTVGGNNYALGTSTAKNKVSSTGELVAGDIVGLLLGMSGEVADIIPASEVDGVYYGVITNVELTTYDVNSSTSNAEYVLSVACTDGVVRQFVVDSDSYKTGRVVSVSYKSGKLTVGRPGSSNISGTFSSDGKKLGNHVLADDVEILDVSKDGQWTVVYPSRLSGVTLKSGSIHYAAFNSNKEITHLILDDITGDMYDYGILTKVEETRGTTNTDSEEQISTLIGSYNYIVNGTSGTLNTTNKLYNVKKGAAIFYYKEGKIDGMRNLKEVKIDELSYLSTTSSNEQYKTADNVQVYIQSNSNAYDLTQLSALDTDKYTLTGYYENIYPAGGYIRLIIANEK